MGSHYKEFIQKYDFPKYLLDFYIKSYNFISDPQNENIDSIPDCFESIKKFWKKDK